MTMHSHNHLMRAVISIYGGQEDNTFYECTDDGIEVASMKQFVTKDASPLACAGHLLRDQHSR